MILIHNGEFMEWEIHVALKQMVPLKAPGPDGMPFLFYQHFWEMMNHEVTTTILYIVCKITI